MKNMIFELINDKVEKVDSYHNNGSLWLIFTDRKKWVIELTKDGTLWYNYYFFEKVFNFFSLNVIENQHYITEWVEDTIQNRVRNTRWEARNGQLAVEDTIQNGVIHTAVIRGAQTPNVEDTIQNGVKNTLYVLSHALGFVEDIIQNGVKHIEPGGYLGSIEMKGKIVHQIESPKQNNEVEDTIQNGIKETNWRTVDNFPEFEQRVIQNGIKETWGYERQPQQRIDHVIEQGIKENPSL